jgi:hypothetical protein
MNRFGYCLWMNLGVVWYSDSDFPIFMIQEYTITKAKCPNTFIGQCNICCRNITDTLKKWLKFWVCKNKYFRWVVSKKKKRKGIQTHVRYLADSAALAPHASPGTWRPLASPTLPPKAPRRHQALNPLRALHSPHSSPRRRATPARDPPVPSFNPSPLCFWQNREYSCGSDEVGRGPLDPLRLRLDLPSQVSDPPIPLGFHVMRVRMRCFSIEVDGLSWVMRRFWRCRLGGELIGQRGAISLSWLLTFWLAWGEIGRRGRFVGYMHFFPRCYTFRCAVWTVFQGTATHWLFL